MRTPSSVTTGRPAKSLGSRSEPMTISHGTPSAAAAALIKADFPMPGSPHRQTATPARPAARRTVTMLVVLVTGMTRTHEDDGAEYCWTRMSGEKRIGASYSWVHLQLVHGD